MTDLPAPTKPVPKQARNMKRRRGMTPKDKTTAIAIERAEFVERVMQMRREGWTLAAIGKAMEISKVRAFNIIHHALAKREIENVDALRNLELTKLDELDTVFYPKAMAGDPFALDRVVKIMNQRASLTGINAPVKSELSGPDEGPLKIVLSSADKGL